jgi:hypothetical protein
MVVSGYTKTSRKSYPGLHLATRITCMSPRCQVDHSTDTRESDEPPRVLELLRIGTPAGSPQIQFHEIPFRVDRQPTTYDRVIHVEDFFSFPVPVLHLSRRLVVVEKSDTQGIQRQTF